MDRSAAYFSEDQSGTQGTMSLLGLDYCIIWEVFLAAVSTMGSARLSRYALHKSNRNSCNLILGKFSIKNRL